MQHNYLTFHLFQVSVLLGSIDPLKTELLRCLEAPQKKTVMRRKIQELTPTFMFKFNQKIANHSAIPRPGLFKWLHKPDIMWSNCLRK